MNIILNGVMDEEFKDIEERLEKNLSVEDYYYKLRDMDINFCQGCWDCWLKTPGLCKLKDDYETILSKIPKADTLTFITPMIAGYESSLIKKAKDRMVSLAHPYIVMYHGEQHHRQRYKKNPDFKVIVLEDEDTTKEDIDLLKETYDRVVLNYRSKMVSFTTIKKGAEIDYVFDAN